MHGTPLPFKASALVCSLFMIIVGLLQPGIASAGSSTEALQVTGQKVRVLLNDMELKGLSMLTIDVTKLLTIMRERFSCEEMSKRALGEEWVKRSEVK
ncbi:MAG: hypothetical protein M3Z35_07640 [Nitrospirota bacterium]|nr:hypothetical protein [Nitrospirota bacterium]